MKVLLVNAYAKSGGASVAAHRLSAALNGVGAEARLLVQNAEGAEEAELLPTRDRWARQRPVIEALPTLFRRNMRSPHWGNAWIGNGATRKAIRDFAPDITHLHWVNHGMLSLRDIARLRGPLVWTLHDSWVFTGGCHSPQGCEGYKKRCGRCPEIGSQRELDISRWNWRRKMRLWRDVPLTVVTPSRWLADCAKSSSLLCDRRIEVIPNAVDTSIFYPRDRMEARIKLGLPLEAPLLLFAAHNILHDWNKGFDLWAKALRCLAAAVPTARAILIGNNGEMIPGLPLPVHDLGALSPESMALAINAADAVVVPSRMENLPNMVAESLASGTPVAAFAVGGIPEMIQNGKTGYLARPHDTDDLAGAIINLLQRGDHFRDACSTFARSTFAPELVARRHMDLYESLLKR